MNDNYILNASPIILLGKADLLKTISPLAKSWIIPKGVIEEVEKKRSIEPYLSQLSCNSKVIRKSSSTTHPSIAAWDLGQGESEVLTLALGKDGVWVVLDDLQARKCAALFDIPLIGSIGLVILAKKKGLIDLAKPRIERLRAAGLHLDNTMLGQIYMRIGE
jgi:predicted nucleic acid-binding protein